MKREWTDLEFADWTLLTSKAALLANKTGPTRLGFAVFLKFFQYAARFPLSIRKCRRFPRVRPIDNIVFDAVINSMLCRTVGRTAPAADGQLPFERREKDHE